MLTKDLLRFRLMNNAVKPSFVKTDDPALLELAASLIALYESSAGSTRGSIEESAGALLKTAKDLKLARGIDKIALDRCEFSSVADCDYPTLRRAVFAKAFSLFGSGEVRELGAFKDAVLSGSSPELAFLKDGLYADLPDNEKLVSMKKLFPKELLERYNCALAQSLLLYCSKLEATVSESDPAKLRRLFKYLKFFRLLAKIGDGDGGGSGAEGSEAHPTKLSLSIDGPASLFENTTKYGLQLASFLPALIQVSEWSMDSQVKLRDRVLRLRLDQDSGLVSHYANFGAYIPEEASMFHKLFKARVPDWTVAGGSPFIRAGGGDLIFPDFSFEGVDGTRVHLELFHKWHSSQLPARLEFCARHPELNLILGVDRALLSGSAMKASLEADPFFSKRGFLFRDFPGVDAVRSLLGSFSGSRLEI